MQLRDYQIEAVDAAFAYLRTRPGNPLIVLPTGAGKSVVIAEIARRVVEGYDRRVIVLQHRKELIEQNAAKIGLGCGLYSAGLNRKQINESVILAGIQSAYKNALDFGRRHLVIIDEAHLVGDEGMFRTFLQDLSSVNPDMRVVGLTATPYRTNQGHLVEGSLFSSVCYEAKIPRLIADGYLSPLTNTASDLYSTEGLHVRGGEFIEAELAALFDDQKKIDQACKQVQAACEGRKSVIVFCSGVQHAYHVAERLGGEVVHGGTTPLERAELIERFRSGYLRYLCNCDVLTTGFDAPNIDCVAILRATMSPGLFVQMAGRGFRKAPGKTDCLILDFGRNIERHGPLDAIDFGRRKGEGQIGDAPEKTCPGCDERLPAGVRVCKCGFIFPPPKLKHDTEASSAEILAKPEEFDVTGWIFSKHTKKETGIPILRVTYQIMGNVGTSIDEWVCLEHEGYARNKATAWWLEHSEESLEGWQELLVEIQESPDRVDAAIACYRDKLVRCPSKITAIKDGRWWRIVGREFGELVQSAIEDELPF